MELSTILGLIPGFNSKKSSGIENIGLASDKVKKESLYYLSLDESVSKVKILKKEIEGYFAELSEYINGNNKFDQPKLYISNIEKNIESIKSLCPRFYIDTYIYTLEALIPLACKKGIEIHLDNLSKAIDSAITYINVDYLDNAKSSLDYGKTMLEGLRIENEVFRSFIELSFERFEVLKQKAYYIEIENSLSQIQNFIHGDVIGVEVTTLISDTFLKIENAKTMYDKFNSKEAHFKLRMLILPATVVLINYQFEQLENTSKSLGNVDDIYFEELNNSISYGYEISKALKYLHNIDDKFLEFLKSIEIKIEKIKEEKSIKNKKKN